jgi:DNA-directed RNA polymerase specialized sigma24 family protein
LLPVHFVDDEFEATPVDRRPELMTSEILIQARMEEDATSFGVRFSRYRRLLHFIAARVLGGPERVKDAVENCWRAASRNPPRFEYETSFRSWLVRVLIDEALAILRQNREALAATTPVERMLPHGLTGTTSRCGSSHLLGGSRFR